LYYNCDFLIKKNQTNFMHTSNIKIKKKNKTKIKSKMGHRRVKVEPNYLAFFFNLAQGTVAIAAAPQQINQ
jgi:hypothetical protein